jgi:hypothetical protein
VLTTRATGGGLMLIGFVAAVSTSVHRGSILPVARAIVIGVPFTFAFLYWFVVVRRRDRPK